MTHGFRLINGVAASMGQRGLNLYEEEISPHISLAVRVFDNHAGPSLHNLEPSRPIPHKRAIIIVEQCISHFLRYHRLHVYLLKDSIPMLRS
jgi:hypothetical protein